MSVNDSKDDPLIICSRGVVNLASQNIQRKLRTMIDQTVFSFIFIKHAIDDSRLFYTAISRKVVGKRARDSLERYCGWFLVHCFSKKFQTMAREAMDVCLRVLKESNKSRFDSYSVRNSVLIISHITFRDCRVHSFFRQPF